MLDYAWEKLLGGPDLVLEHYSGRTLLHAASAAGDVTTVELLAARRGNVNVAEALLDCGANIEARDSLGDTPLRRSVNCDQAQVARLLVTRGADVHSKGSKGVTPLLAARTS